MELWIKLVTEHISNLWITLTGLAVWLAGLTVAFITHCHVHSKRASRDNAGQPRAVASDPAQEGGRHENAN